MSLYLKAVSGALCRDSAQACWMAPSTPDHGSLSERPGRSPRGMRHQLPHGNRLLSVGCKLRQVLRDRCLQRQIARLHQFHDGGVRSQSPWSDWQHQKASPPSWLPSSVGRSDDHRPGDRRVAPAETTGPHQAILIDRLFNCLVQSDQMPRQKSI